MYDDLLAEHEKKDEIDLLNSFVTFLLEHSFTISREEDDKYGRGFTRTIDTAENAKKYIYEFLGLDVEVITQQKEAFLDAHLQQFYQQH